MREVPTARWHEFIQNIQTGLHHECPSGEYDLIYFKTTEP